MTPETHLFKAFIHLGAGLAVGISSLGAGFAIGITGDVGVRAATQQPRLFIGLMLLQIFSEVLGRSFGASVTLRRDIADAGCRTVWYDCGAADGVEGEQRDLLNVDDDRAFVDSKIAASTDIILGVQQSFALY